MLRPIFQGEVYHLRLHLVLGVSDSVGEYKWQSINILTRLVKLHKIRI